MLVDGDRIVDVGPAAELAARAPDAELIGGPGHVVLPGLVNAHQHLTGDRLVRSAIPDDIDAAGRHPRWALPLHAAHTGDDDELSATLALVEAVTNGITFTVEAGHGRPPRPGARGVRRRRRRRHARLLGLGRAPTVRTPAPSTPCWPANATC